MFHPPKIPQRQWNGNGTGLQRGPIANPLNVDVAPIVDPFFQPLLAVVGSATGSLKLLNLELNLLNYNGFGTGGPLQPVGHPLQ